jgi:hypothetical protein
VVVFIKPIAATSLQGAEKNNTEIPRRIKAIHIFISRVDDFDYLVVSLASFPPMCIIFCDRFKSKVVDGLTG